MRGGSNSSLTNSLTLAERDKQANFSAEKQAIEARLAKLNITYTLKQPPDYSKYDSPLGGTVPHPSSGAVAGSDVPKLPAATAVDPTVLTTREAALKKRDNIYELMPKSAGTKDSDGYDNYTDSDGNTFNIGNFRDHFGLNNRDKFENLFTLERYGWTIADQKAITYSV